MAAHSTTRLSSEGQVVIPEEARRALGLSEGDQFLVVGLGDAMVLKGVTSPKIENFRELLAQPRAEAGRARIRKADLRPAIARARRRAK
jgi:AbrB family looped-hinge helix DNA binding protein